MLVRLVLKNQYNILISIYLKSFFLFFDLIFVEQGVLEARNSNNPILSNKVAQCGVRMRDGTLRAGGTLLID